jgi:hypothetical protein
MPMRILLIGAVVFLAAWFTILKPGGAEEDVAPVQPANTAPADVLAKLPKDVAKAVAARKTLVLGVFNDYAENWRPMADDDRYVRNALKKANRYDGQVLVKHVSVADVSTYGPLVNELDVTQSPSVVVIDRNLKGTVLTGYVDRVAINQAIADARRDSIVPAITDEYLRAANEICARFKLRYARLSGPTIRGKKARDAALDRYVKLGLEYARAVRSTPAPAEWSGLRRQWLDSIITDQAALTLIVESIKNDNLFLFLAGVAGLDPDKADALDRRFDEAGVTTCVNHRRS